MISKVQAYNANQPNFTSKVRVSEKLVNSLSENGQKVLKRQIRPLEKNGNNDLVVLNMPSGYGGIEMTVFKKNKNTILQNDIWTSCQDTLLKKTKGHKLVDLYNKVINETETQFWESKASKVLFEYL